MGMDELIDLFAEGDELVSNTAFEDMELAYDVANGATFDGVVFRSCVFGPATDFGDDLFGIEREISVHHPRIIDRKSVV